MKKEKQKTKWIKGIFSNAGYLLQSNALLVSRKTKLRENFTIYQQKELPITATTTIYTWVVQYQIFEYYWHLKWSHKLKQNMVNQKTKLTKTVVSDGIETELTEKLNNKIKKMRTSCHHSPLWSW